MKIAIFIPSHRRKENQKTFENIPISLKKRTFIVVDKKDYKSYVKSYGIKNVLMCPKEGICQTRQWIIDNCTFPYALMLDDDMQFDYRNEEMRLSKCSKKQFKQMVKLLESWLEKGIIHVGISQRFGNNRITEDFVDTTRMNNAYAFNVKKLKKLKIRFDGLEKKYNERLVMEDFWVTLNLLTNGYKNRVTYKYCWSQKQSGDKGGCSLYRNDAMQKRSAELLAKEFPDFVRVVKKESKVQWGGFKDKFRYDVNIQWKKSFGKRKNTGGIERWLKK